MAVLSFVSRYVVGSFQSKSTYWKKAFGLKKTASLDRRLFSTSCDIIALDFDGVICASASESSVSAIAAAKQLWPNELSFALQSDDYECLRKMLIRARPSIETGYENVLLSRYFWKCLSSTKDTNVPSNMKHKEDLIVDIVDSLTKEWNETLRLNLLQNYNTTKEELVRAYGSARDNAISSNFDSWVSLNSIYPHVTKYFHNNHQPSLDLQRLYIITKKQSRFVEAILNANNIPIIREGHSNNKIPTADTDPAVRSNNVYDLENIHGSKANVLRHLIKLHTIHSPSKSKPPLYPTIHFVEDRYETLTMIEQLQQQYDDLQHVKLYLVDWGYNTETQRQLAAKNSKIQVIGAEAFCSLLNKVASDEDAPLQ